MKPRAEVIKSVPTHKAHAISVGVINFPELITLILSRKPYSINLSISFGKLSRKGNPTSSINDIGAAPVPPSALSSVIKSGACSMPRFLIACIKSSSQPYAPNTILNPTGLPAACRIFCTISSRSSTELISG